MMIRVVVAASAILFAVPVGADELTAPAPVIHKVVHHKRRHWHHWALVQLRLFVPPTSSPKGGKAPPAPPSAPAVDPVLSIVQKLQATLPDWQAADAVAVGQDPANPANPQSHKCFSEVVKFLQGLTTAAPGQGPAGDSPIVAYAKSKVLHAQISPGLPPELMAYCAPLVETNASFLSKIAAMDGLNISVDDLAKAGF